MTVPARISRHGTPWRHIGVLGLSVLTGCSAAALGPDALEIANIRHYNEVPRSSPTAMVRAFDRFCVNRPATLQASDAQLRAASYVPTRKQAGSGVRLYLVDDKRPAVAISRNMCLVQAATRTGQTEMLRAYTAKAFPDARPMSPDDFGEDIEQAWAVPGNPPAIIATQRRLEPGNRSRYALIFYLPQDKPKQ